MQRLALLFGFASIVSTFACGKNDCEDGYERLKAQFDDCRIEVPATIAAPVDGAECSEVQGDSLQAFAETAEKGTCESLRAFTGAQ